MVTQQYQQGDSVCVELEEHDRPARGTADALTGSRWQEGMIMAVMQDCRYRVGF